MLEASVKARRRAWAGREIPLEDDAWRRLSDRRASPGADAEMADLLGAVGRAIAERAAVVVDDYQRDGSAIPSVQATGVQAVAAVPLMEEGRLLGALSVATLRPGQSFDADDVEVLELLAAAAAAALVGLERARLDGVMRAARTAEHELNNRLAPTVGYAELLASDPALPPDLRALATLTMRGARDAARIVQQLQQVTRLEETDWGPNVRTTIDIERSIDEPHG
jgi:GAF domain-containing protein